MTADGKLILCIPMVFVIVSSALSVLEGDNNTLCWTNVSTVEARNISYNETYRTPAQWPFFNFSITQTRTVYKTKSKNVWTLTQTCCTGYKNESGTCKPECPSGCMNGYCAKPNICKCHFGWSGDDRFCNEPLLCYIAQPDQVNSSEPVSKIEDLETTQDTTNGLILIEWKKLPECPLEYICHIHNEDINSTRSGNMTYYLVPIHSSCEAVASPLTSTEASNYIIGVVMGIIILCLMIIGVVCVLRRRKRSRESVNEDLCTDLVYDDVVVAPIPNSEVVNPTPISDDNYVTPICHYGNPAEIRVYKAGGTKPIDDYDDVAMRVVHEYDDFKEEPTYDYDDVNQKPIYDNGANSTRQNREYDYVATGPIREYDDVEPAPSRGNKVHGARPIRNYENVNTR